MQSNIKTLRDAYPGAVVKTHANVTENWIIFTAVVCNGTTGDELAVATRVYPSSGLEPLTGKDVLLDALAVLGITESPIMTNLANELAKDGASITLEEAEPCDGPEETREPDTAAPAPSDSEEANASAEVITLSGDAQESVTDGALVEEYIPDEVKPKTKQEKARAAAAEAVFSIPENAPLPLRKFDGKKMGEILAEKPSIIKYLMQPGGKSLNLKPEIYEAAKILAK